MFNKCYEIKFYEIDHKKQLKESVLLNFLQDIAAVHAEKLGFGYSYISEKNLSWFLLKYHLKVFKYPTNNNSITIKTWPKRINKLSCLRDFEVYDEKSEKIAAVCSSWVLIDPDTKKIMVPSKVLLPFPSCEDNAFETSFPKISEPQRIDYNRVFEVRYDDIDINQHVNNANYLIWALETVDFGFKSTHLIKELEIQYKKELKYGSNVTSVLEKDNKQLITTHLLKNVSDDEHLCNIKIHWQKA